MNTEFDRAAAQRGLRLLRLAASRWQEQFQQLAGEQIRDEQHRDELSTVLLGHAMEFLMWARGLDDWCKGGEGRVGLPGYRESRESEIGLLEGARYVTNHALHQLADLTQLLGGFNFPFSFPFRFDKVAEIQWMHASHLPPSEEELNDTQRRYRRQYEEHLAGREVRPTIDWLLEWFERHLVE